MDARARMTRDERILLTCDGLGIPAKRAALERIIQARLAALECEQSSASFAVHSAAALHTPTLGLPPTGYDGEDGG